MKVAIRWLVPFAALLAAFLIGRATSSGSGLVYVCSAQPCTAGQELEVFDKAGSPIWSVGEFGGAGVYGDNLKVYGPRSVSRPAVTISWEPPLAYDRRFRQPTSCSAPSLWVAPQGTWRCVAGKWKQSA